MNVSAHTPAQGTLDVGALYQSHGHVVLRRARQILGNEAEAEEALQEVFISLVKRPDQFQGRSALSTFLYGMTTNLCLNRIRNRKNRQRLLDVHVKPMTEQSKPSPAEKMTLLRQLLVKVEPPELAEVATYYYMDEMTHAEIAEVLGCSRRHVGNLLDRFHEAAEKIGADS